MIFQWYILWLFILWRYTVYQNKLARNAMGQRKSTRSYRMYSLHFVNTSGDLEHHQHQLHIKPKPLKSISKPYMPRTTCIEYPKPPSPSLFLPAVTMTHLSTESVYFGQFYLLCVY